MEEFINSLIPLHEQNNFIIFLLPGDPDEKNYTENIKMLHQLIEVTSGEGSVYLPENHLNSKVK